VDWRDEDETMHLVYYIVFSAFAAVVLSRLIPINILCLIGGLSLFIKNTAFFQAAQTTLQPVVMKGLQENVDYVREAISNVSRATSRAGAGVSTTSVQIFENQRWWSGLGWINHLLKSERPAFSDETGGVSKASKENYALPSDEWVCRVS
jgi:hypothetical protein